MDGFYLGIVFGGVKLKVYSVVELWEVYINIDISDLEKNGSDFPPVSYTHLKLPTTSRG